MLFRDLLSSFDYVKIRTVKMVGLLLNVFCKRKHIPFLKEMAIQETRTGILGLWVKLCTKIISSLLFQPTFDNF